jgi:organic hydroperoxide reductase OsmC/OhrA
MAPTHHFEARAIWRSEDGGMPPGNHRLELEGKPAIAASVAPHDKGDPTRANPEELFVAALASCQMLSYLALAARTGVAVLAYEDRARGTLTIADKKMRFTEVTLRPRITLAPGSDATKARELVHAAHDVCFIANSVSCRVLAEPEIVVGT